jgi:hypothetical protein
VWAFKGVLVEITNTLFEHKKPGDKSNIREANYKIIELPPGFGLFDLGINQAMNEQAPLYQHLQSNVKV